MTTLDVPAQAGPPPAEQRGQTTIADRVVERIAARAAQEVEGAYGVTRWLRGKPPGGADRPPARVTAQVDGQLATFTVRLSIAYPEPVREVSRQVREHMRERVGELTGLTVRQVDIEVTRLVRQPPVRRVR